MPGWLEELLPILILLAAVGVVIARLPKVEGLDYSAKFRKRRVMNWVPLGLTYAFLYMGRYNLKVSQKAFGAMQDSAGDPVMPTPTSPPSSWSAPSSTASRSSSTAR